MTAALAVLGAAAALAVLAWWLPAVDRVRWVVAVTLALALAVSGALTAWGTGTATWPEQGRDTLVVLGAVLAVAGGGPLTTTAFRLADAHGPRRDLDSVEEAGEILRGGAWIGCLERAAVYASILAGWPEGLAVVLALKGLARYPELRGPGHPDAMPLHGVAERFIIGTFVSVLWSVACAGVVLS